MTMIVQGQRGFHVLSQIEMPGEDGVETAASWAADHIRQQPDLGWIVARYVEADKPNRNGHIFPLDELKNSYQNVVHKPLNMLHRRHHVIGAFTAAKLLDGVARKIGDPPMPMAASENEIAAAVMNPHVETLAATWKYAFPDEYAAIVKAFKEHSAFVSMEAVPKSMTCQACQGNFAYEGPVSASYCAHLQASPRAPRALHNAHFVGGGIIIPPTRPGWGQADIRDIAGLIEKEPDAAEELYDAFAEVASHLDPLMWETLMAMTIAEVTADPVQAYFDRMADAKTPAVFVGGFQIAPPAVPTQNSDLGDVTDHDQSAMVCFSPPPDIAEQLAAAAAAADPDAGEDPDDAETDDCEALTADEMHVTLGFFGKIDDEGNVSLDEDENEDAGASQDQVLGAVAAYAAGTPALPVAKLSGVGQFDLGDGNSVVYASVDAPGLPQLRQGLVQALAAAGAPVSELHGYTPHLTLAYFDSDDPDLPKLPSGLTWPVTAIEVWWAGEKHSFDLAG